MRFFTYIALIATAASALHVHNDDNGGQSFNTRAENIARAKLCKSVMPEAPGAKVPLAQDPHYKKAYMDCIKKGKPVSGPAPRDPEKKGGKKVTKTVSV